MPRCKESAFCLILIKQIIIIIIIIKKSKQKDVYVVGHLKNLLALGLWYWIPIFVMQMKTVSSGDYVLFSEKNMFNQVQLIIVMTAF